MFEHTPMLLVTGKTQLWLLALSTIPRPHLLNAQLHLFLQVKTGTHVDSCCSPVFVESSQCCYSSPICPKPHAVGVPVFLLRHLLSGQAARIELSHVWLHAKVNRRLQRDVRWRCSSSSASKSVAAFRDGTLIVRTHSLYLILAHSLAIRTLRTTLTNDDRHEAKECADG